MMDNRERERKIKMAKWANFFNQSNISNVIVYEHNERLQWEKSTDHTHNNFQYQSKKKDFHSSLIQCSEKFRGNC